MSAPDPFLAGLAAGTIRFVRCGGCGTALPLDPLACRHCGSTDLAWADAAGTGAVYAVTRVHRAPSDDFRVLVPYDLVLVDLDEGARVMGHAEPGIAIGDRVAASVFDHAGMPLIRFRRQGDRV